jgi:hypothetical protein
MGKRIKQSGYKLKMILIDNLMRALWSRDLSTLWHGIGRTLAPMLLNDKSNKKYFDNIFYDCVIICNFSC